MVSCPAQVEHPVPFDRSPIEDQDALAPSLLGVLGELLGRLVLFDLALSRANTQAADAALEAVDGVQLAGATDHEWRTAHGPGGRANCRSLAVEIQPGLLLAEHSGDVTVERNNLVAEEQARALFGNALGLFDAAATMQFWPWP